MCVDLGMYAGLDVLVTFLPRPKTKSGFRIYVCHSPGFISYTMWQIARLNTHHFGTGLTAPENLTAQG